MKHFIVKHDVIEADKYVFPGVNNKFFPPDKMPQGVIRTLGLAKELCQQYHISLVKGELNLKENYTLVYIDADTEESIEHFYDDLGHKFSFLEIKECDEFVNDLKDILIKAKNSIKTVKLRLREPA